MRTTQQQQQKSNEIKSIQKFHTHIHKKVISENLLKKRASKRINSMVCDIETVKR